MVPRYLVNFDAVKIDKVITDVVVVGSGIAGLTAALEISKQFDVALVTKSELKETATWYAQGGVATAISSEDSPKLHLRDTLEAGAGLCNRDAVDVLVSDGPDRIGELIRLGTEFDWHGDRIGLSREGGHSLARILHSGDTTGSEIEATLIRTANAWQSVQVFEHRFSLDILTDNGRCVGILCLDEPTGRLVLHLAKAVVLAAGGAGQLFSITTNPPISTGDGMAMAYRAGAILADMEFIQFHPTALDQDSMPRFLITEALRGDGAFLRDCNGERFMVGRHPLAELAPRDVVTREMVNIMQRCGDDPVYLDATHIPEAVLKERFPNIWNHCSVNGINIAKDLIPVRPAAHYTIGGVKTDLNGETIIPGLYATGEVACTGVHGANRLASNSLLEGLVFSKHIANLIMHELSAEENGPVLEFKLEYRMERPQIDLNIERERRWLQRLMTDYVGVVRSEKGLEFAISQLKERDRILRAQFKSLAGFELQNMLCIAGLVARSALARRESRGVHYREDYPEPSDDWVTHLEHHFTEDAVAG
ncbi:MAG: L-aspartate oxidase [Actinobacteria bacterium]|nr:L-aspartate oxidase [Actinomycetota bacterium]